MTTDYIYEIIDLDQDEKHNPVFTLHWNSPRNLTLRARTEEIGVKQKVGAVE